MTDRRYIVAVVAWPFVFLAPYTLNSISIGNDFSILYYVYKVYLLSLWNSFSIGPITPVNRMTRLAEWFD